MRKSTALPRIEVMLRLPPALAAQLRREAAKQNVSVNEFCRHGLDSYLQQKNREPLSKAS